MSISYAKLKDGSWGIRIEGEKVKEGQSVSVRKKSGESKREVVGKIIWTGNGVSLATIAGSSTDDAKSSNRPVCAECGRPGSLVQDCEDGLWKHYNCCDIPP